MVDRYKKMNIIWSFDNPGAFKYIIRKVALDALKRKDCEAVQLTLVGSTVKSLVEHPALYEGMAELVEAGVSVVACLESAKQYAVCEALSAIEWVELKKLASRAADDASGPDEKIVMV